MAEQWTMTEQGYDDRTVDDDRTGGRWQNRGTMTGHGDDDRTGGR